MKIQKYNSQILPTSDTPAVKSLQGERLSPVPVAKPQTQGIDQTKIWESINGFAEKVTNIGEKINVAQDIKALGDTSRAAKDRYNLLLNEMQSPEFRQQHNYKEYDEYFTDRSKEITEYLLENSNPGTAKGKDDVIAAIADIELSNRAQVRSFTIQGQVAEIQSSIPEYMASLRDDVIIADGKFDDETIGKSLTKAEAYLAGMRAAGVITPGQEEAFLNKFQRELYVGIWLNRIERDPADVIERLSKPIKGMDEHTRLTYLDKAVKEKEKKDKEDGESQIYAEIIDRFPDDYESAIKFIEDPKNYPNIKLATRNRLAATLDKLQSRKDERDNEVNNQTAGDFLNMAIDPQQYGELTTPMILESKLSTKNKVYFLNLKEKKDTSLSTTTNTKLYLRLSDEAYAGTMDPNEPLQYMGAGLSVKDAEHLRKIVIDSQKEENKIQHRWIARAIKSGSERILGTDTELFTGSFFIGVEAVSTKAVYDFTIALINEVAVRKTQGQKAEDILDPNKPKEYILDNILIPFLGGASKKPETDTTETTEPKETGPFSRKSTPTKRAPRPSGKTGRGGLRRLWQP